MIEHADISQAQKLQMQQEITVFEDILGGCERLLRTPIPVSYTRHSTRCIMIWLLTFPIWLQTAIGPALIPTTALVAFLLLGVVLDLPRTVCRTLHSSLLIAPTPCHACTQ